MVAADEREISGLRAILNLGHTFAHAIETATGYNQWLHGEAVAVGLLMAVDLSARLGWLPAEVITRTRKLLLQANLPVRLPNGLTTTNLLTLMIGDKKNINRRLRLVLLKAIGQPIVTEGVGEIKLQEKLQEVVTEYMS